MENALKQYLDLYESHKDLICSHAPHAFNRLRTEAFKSLSELGLPAKGSENYEVSDLAGMLAPDYGINLARVPLDVNVAQSFRCGVPHLSSALFFLLNDQWAEGKNSRNALPDGVEIGPLSSFLRDDPEAQEKYGSIASIANPIVALNTLLVQEGVFIRIKKGVKLTRPIQLVEIMDGTMPLMSLRRMMVIMEEGSEAQILICDHNSVSHIPMCCVTVSEVFAANDSKLDIYVLEESSRKNSRLSALYLEQQRSSDVLIDGITLANGATRNEYHCSFRGPDAKLRLYGLGVEDEDRVLDNYSKIDHNVGDCFTEELFKYLLEDEARGAFTGRIYVAPGASKTEAYQSNRNMVGSDRARMFSKPQLEIYNDDVKCSHGSATGRIDAMQLFYLRSRGLDKDEAKLLLKQAFMADVIDGIRLPMLKDRISALVARRIAGQSAACSDCDACFPENENPE